MRGCATTRALTVSTVRACIESLLVVSSSYDVLFFTVERQPGVPRFCVCAEFRCRLCVQYVWYYGQVRQDQFIPVVFVTLRRVGQALLQQNIKGFTLESLYRLAQASSWECG